MLMVTAALCAGPLFLTAIVGCSGGCAVFKGAPIAEGSDPIVVHAERTQGYALDTFDAFVRWENANRTLLNDPAVKNAADHVRRNYKKWDDDLTVAIKAYKAVRSKENADKLGTALTLISQGLDIARRYFLPTSATPNP